MTRRLLQPKVLGALVLSCLLSANAALATILNVPQKYQEKDQWCWAGCSQAILEYYGTSKTQTQIAQYGTNGENTWNYLYGSDATRNGIDLILRYFANLPTTPYDSTISQPSVQINIDARRPFVIRWGWDTGGGHFVVARGIEASTVYLMDPWNGPTINTYSWVVQGSSHTWTHTLTLNQSAPSKIIGTIYLLLGP